ncbi:MAG: hypothetical protein EA397_00580 [Deltaproteobacteria bacterium]|nr:MAG: hypothetical protein EA397_00580 [Deltaproteobacteria bacterium]
MTAASPLHRLAAWSVHAYTSLGLPLAVVAALALFNDDAQSFFLALCAAVFVDATDGFLARAVKVREVLPDFDGRRLDDIVDFITFALLPTLAVIQFGLFPEGFAFAAVIPLLASGYGFCQDQAKTDESFVGFPSYWNIVIMYLYLLELGPWVNLGVLITLSVLVFVPIHYVYPTRTRMLRPVTVIGGFSWAAVMVLLMLQIEASWAKPVALVSLVYPVYYFALSAVNHARITRQLRATQRDAAA